MNRRALTIALLVGALGLVLLLLYQRRFEIEASGGEKVKLLVALKRLERGKPITDDMIATREVPTAYVDGRSIRENEKSKVLGLRLGNTVKEQELLLWSDLATGSDEHRDLSSLVLPGYRAVTIRASQDSASGLVRPGDYVDVVGVLATGNGEARTSVVLLQRVLVLAVGNETSPDAIDQRANTGRASGDNVLTLSLTLQEAQVVSLAADRGRLSVVVRHVDDTAKGATPDIKVESILTSEGRSKLGGVRQGPVNLTAGGNQ